MRQKHSRCHLCVCVRVCRKGQAGGWDLVWPTLHSKPLLGLPPLQTQTHTHTLRDTSLHSSGSLAGLTHRALINSARVGVYVGPIVWRLFSAMSWLFSVVYQDILAKWWHFVTTLQIPLKVKNSLVALILPFYCHGGKLLAAKDEHVECTDFYWRLTVCIFLTHPNNNWEKWESKRCSFLKPYFF